MCVKLLFYIYFLNKMYLFIIHINNSHFALTVGVESLRRTGNTTLANCVCVGIAVGVCV